MKKINETKKGFSILLDFSHEIRNPLNGINGLTTILLDTDLTPEQKSLVWNIDKNSQLLNNILELMLDYSKILNGMIRYSTEQVFIYPWLQKELDKIFQTFKNNRIKFCYYISPNLNGIAIFDPYIFSEIIKLSSLNIAFDKNITKLELKIESSGQIVRLEYAYKSQDTEKDKLEENQHLKISQALLNNYVELMGGEIHENIGNSEISMTIEVPLKCSPITFSSKQLKANELLKNFNLIMFNYHSDSCESTSKYLEYLGLKLYRDERDIRQIHLGELDSQYQLVGIDISLMSKHEFQIMDDIRRFSKLPIIMFKDADKTNQKILPLQKDVVVMYKPVSPNNLSYVLQSVLNSQADQLRDWIKNPISTLVDYHQSLKILIADDESINQRVLREYLGKLHLKADFVNNGEKAVELYQKNKYDLLFMDIQMPVMNGVVATEKIRSIKNNHHPYIVAITADALKGGKLKYKEAGMNDFLLKPVSLEGITKIIQKYIEQFKH